MKRSELDLETLIAADRVASAPGRADRERNRRALAGKLGALTVLGAGAAKGSLASVLASSATIKLLATVVVVASATSGVAYLAANASKHQAPQHKSGVEQTTLAAPAPAVSSEAPRSAPSARPSQPQGMPGRPAGVPASPSEVTTAPSAVVTAPAQLSGMSSARAFPADADDRLAAETRLLGSAQAALRSGDAARALMLLDRVAREFAAGVLSEEAGATRVFALCQLGRVGEARAAAAAFADRFRSSPLLTRVQSSCR